MGALIARITGAAFLAIALLAALAPLMARSSDAPARAKDFPGWPAQFEGATLRELPLTSRETSFVQDFPGRVGRFSDGRREIIVRWVGAPTRKLHSAADCFRGSGYSVTPLPAKKDAGGAAMGCFRATHGSDSLIVCEVIHGPQGASWPDVSAWYWTAAFGAGAGPWWSYVVAEPDLSPLSR